MKTALPVALTPRFHGLLLGLVLCAWPLQGAPQASASDEVKAVVQRFLE